MNDIPVFEDLLELNLLPHDMDKVAEKIIGQFVRGKALKYGNTARLLIGNNHESYVSNINAVFQSFCCPISDTFCNRKLNLERNLTKGSQRVENINPRNVH